MTTLRKACRNCTVSKRKCVVRLPKCTRCVQKALECRYDLEPLSIPAGKPEIQHQYSLHQSNYDCSGYCVMKIVKCRGSDIDPAICCPGHEDALEVIRLGYLSIPDLIRAGRPAVFLHPKMQLNSNYHNFASFEEKGNSGMNSESFQRLVQLDVKSVPIKEFLAALQSLLVYLATFLFSLRQAEQTKGEKFLSLQSEWAQTLLVSAQTKMPRNQSLWQEWLFGESVRRTIIMSYALSLAYSSFKNGYCSNWLFVESLPFDRRAGLWMAESSQAWIAAAQARTGKDVGEKLSSFHEFAENVDGLDPNFCGDMFLTLLAFGHNGVRTNHELKPGGN